MLNKVRLFFQENLLPGAQDSRQQDEHRIQLAVGALLLEMTRMDGEIRPEQCARVESAIRDHFDLSEAETKALIELAEAERDDATDYFQFTSLINAHYDAEQKIAIIEQLWTVALADDKLHRHEEHLVRKIAQLLHVPHSAFIAARHRVDDTRPPH